MNNAAPLGRFFQRGVFPARLCRSRDRTVWCRRGRVKEAADGAAPGVGAVGVDEFVLGEGTNLGKGLAQVGEGGGCFWFHAALRDGNEEAAESGSQIVGGDVVAGEI